MNRTIEQWQVIGMPGCAQHYGDKDAIGSLLTDAVSDLQELARQRDELLHMLDSIDRAELLEMLDCDNFNRYMDISKGNV